MIFTSKGQFSIRVDIDIDALYNEGHIDGTHRLDMRSVKLGNAGHLENL